MLNFFLKKDIEYLHRKYQNPFYGALAKFLGSSQKNKGCSLYSLNQKTKNITSPLLVFGKVIGKTISKLSTKLIIAQDYSQSSFEQLSLLSIELYTYKDLITLAPEKLKGIVIIK